MKKATLGLSLRGPALLGAERHNSNVCLCKCLIGGQSTEEGKGRGRKAPWEGCDECSIHQICGLKGLWSDLLQTSI